MAPRGVEVLHWKFSGAGAGAGAGGAGGMKSFVMKSFSETVLLETLTVSSIGTQNEIQISSDHDLVRYGSEGVMGQTFEEFNIQTKKV